MISLNGYYLNFDVHLIGTYVLLDGHIINKLVFEENDDDKALNLLISWMM